MPVWYVLVGDTGGDIEHDNSGLSIDVITVSKTAKLLLTSCVPNIKGDLTKVLDRVSHRLVNMAGVV
jgi:hypothetical protein